MITLSYVLSPALNGYLQKIELLRREILLVPLSPKVELQYRWGGMLQKVYLSSQLSDHTFSKQQVIEIITSHGKRKLGREEKDILNYRRALDHLYYNWYVSNKPINVKAIITLYQVTADEKTNIPEHSVRQIADYLQASQEHPLIQSAIAQLQMLQSAPFRDGNRRMARLLGYMFMYKYGLDFRGFLVIEDYWKRFPNAFVVSEYEGMNVSAWLENYVLGIMTQLEKVAQDLLAKRSNIDIPNTFWELTDRHKEILALLEEPGSTITNKKVQSEFKISQITASRDLAKLTVLGLLITHGKGRSVYYTRV